MSVDDVFRRMWSDQRAFMGLLVSTGRFPEFPVDITSKTGQQDIVNVFHHCSDELHEAKFELKNAKRHRKTEIDEFDREHFIEELVDAQKLLLELLIMSGVSMEEFVDTYFKKSEVNETRVRNNY